MNDSIIAGPSELATSRAHAATLTLEQVHAFLKPRYKHDRFEGRNNTTWGTDYSATVAKSALWCLQRHGYTIIPLHESVTGESLIFDGELNLRDSAFFHRIIRDRATCHPAFAAGKDVQPLSLSVPA